MIPFPGTVAACLELPRSGSPIDGRHNPHVYTIGYHGPSACSKCPSASLPGCLSEHYMKTVPRLLDSFQRMGIRGWMQRGGWLRCVGDCGATLVGRAVLGYGPAAYSGEDSRRAGCGLLSGGVRLRLRRLRRAARRRAEGSCCRCLPSGAGHLRRCRPDAPGAG